MVLDEKSRFARTVPNPISSNIKIIKQRLISGQIYDTHLFWHLCKPSTASRFPSFFWNPTLSWSLARTMPWRRHSVKCAPKMFTLWPLKGKHMEHDDDDDDDDDCDDDDDDVYPWIWGRPNVQSGGCMGGKSFSGFQDFFAGLPWQHSREFEMCEYQPPKKMSKHIKTTYWTCG